MAFTAGSGTKVSRKTITSHLMLEYDDDDQVVAVVATQSMFGIGLWGAVDNVVRLTGADLRINLTPDDTQPVEVRRVRHQDKQAKRVRAQAVMLEAKRR